MQHDHPMIRMSLTRGLGLLLVLSHAAATAAGENPAATHPAKTPVTNRRTTLLVPLPQEASWQDLAFLAAVPAATVVNAGAPSLIALDATATLTPEIQDYASRYRPDQVALLGNAPIDLVVANRPCQRLAAGSAEEAACKLSATFWQSCPTAVICPDDHYESALVASALAARLRAPLLFAVADKLSESTTREIRRLQVRDLLVIGPGMAGVRAVQAAALRVTALPGAGEVMAWAKSQQLPVRYLAALNPLDRTHTVIKKLSLAGALLAAGRDGLVAPLAFATQWKIPFSGTELTGERPPGLPPSQAPPKTGRITMADRELGFLLTGKPKQKELQVYFDINRDGAYQGAGEGPFASGDTVELLGKRQVITLGTNCGAGKADVRLTWPPVEDLCAALRAYYAALGAAPEFLCLIGFPEAVPHAIRGNLGVVDEVTSDLPYANADDDPFAEICVARVVAENASFATLFASRVLTYASLLTAEWQDQACQAQWENTYDKLFENVDFKAPFRHTTEHLQWSVAPSAGNKGKRASTFDQTSPLARCAIITHTDHSWWHELGSTFGWDADTLLAPCVVESGGCLTAALDREADYRSVVARLLRKGAVSFTGNTREGCAPQELQRMEFWSGVLAGQALGQAHRRSINSALATVLDKTRNKRDAYNYQLHIRTLFGDPAFTMRVPGPPRSAPAHTTIDGDWVTVHAPAQWWPVDMYFPPDWKRWTGKKLHVLRAAGTYALREWCQQQYDREETCITAEFTTRRNVARITQVQQPPSPLGIKGTWHADDNSDGSKTYRWVVRLADFDQINGLMVNAVDHLDYKISYN
jgi:hypothetical protein